MQFSVECQKEAGISLVFLYLVLWLVIKTFLRLSTNWLLVLLGTGHMTHNQNVIYNVQGAKL